MSRILRLYVIREVALPTLLSLLTITFILLIGIVNDLISLVLQPNVSAVQILGILGDFVPSIFVFAIPMAILIGVLVGVGRMALDREIVAIRASGVNLFTIFYPAILVALAVSLALLIMSGGLFPRFYARGMDQIDKLKFAIIESLEPGQLHDKPGGEDNDLILYFRGRDLKTRDMLGVTIKLDEIKGIQTTARKLDDQEKKRKTEEKVEKSDIGAKSGASERDRLAERARRAARGIVGDANAPEEDLPKGEATMIFAERGSIRTAALDNATSGMPDGAIMLHLRNGSIHRLNPDSAKPDYVVVRFEDMERTFFESPSDEKKNKALTSGELRTVMVDQTIKGDRREAARRQLIERHSIAWAGFVFALVGIPLAIWMRPSGKSWGIMIAIGLMLVYYLLMRMGLSMVAVNKPLGSLAAFSPNLLFVVLGAGLWWHNLRS